MKHLYALITGLLAAGAALAQQANAPVVISQIYGAGGTANGLFRNDYVELFNRSSSSVSVQGWSVQYASATGSGLFGGNAITTLTGSIPAGGYYLVRLSSSGSGGALLPAHDAAGSVDIATANGKVALVDTTEGIACNGGGTPCTPGHLARIVDLVGYGSANFSEGAAAPAASATLALFRAGDGCTDTDVNRADFATRAPSPRNSAIPAAPCGASAVTISGTADPAVVLPGGSTVLAAQVSGGNGPYTLQCDLTPIGGTAAQTLTFDGTRYTFNATVSAGTTPGGKSLSCTATDSGSRTGTGTIALTVSSPSFSCGSGKTLISAIQGSGVQSTMIGALVEIEGVVTASFQGSSRLNGYFIQDEGDGLPETSDGIFIDEVNGSVGAVSAGQRVRVRGTVAETFGQTVINNISAQAVCGTGNVPPADVTLPVSTSTFLERYEGMVVRFPQQLVVNDTYNLGRFNEVGLAPSRLFVPTQVVLPGAPAIELQELNDRSRIILDDGSNLTYSSLAPAATYPIQGGGLSATNTLRLGQRVSTIVGVLGFGFSSYRVHPLTPVTFNSEDNPRPSTAPAVGGRIRVAFANVLNYFTTFGSRGANTSAEFDRQKAKIVSGILAMDPAVLGISEMQNDANTSLSNLVAALNESAPGRFAYINTGITGTDLIRNAIIYQPAVVQPVGTHKVLDSAVDPRALTTRNRPAIAQTFKLLSGQKPDAQHFTFVVNHLRSKGSACSSSPSDPNLNDGQDDCNLSRVSMTRALIEWLATNPTGDPTPVADRRVLLTGDFNAYLREDPIRALTDPAFSKGASAVFPAGLPASPLARYLNLAERLIGAGSYSYLFGGQSGSLDHAFANPALYRAITGVATWHINADEPVVLDYNTDFDGNSSDAPKSAAQISTYYSSAPFRSADHDPMLIGFNPLCGDLDDDGDIDTVDQGLVRNAIGKTPVNRRYDFDLDGQVTLTDFRLWSACAAQAR